MKSLRGRIAELAGARACWPENWPKRSSDTASDRWWLATSQTNGEPVAAADFGAGPVGEDAGVKAEHDGDWRAIRVGDDQPAMVDTYQYWERFNAMMDRSKAQPSDPFRAALGDLCRALGLAQPTEAQAIVVRNAWVRLDACVRDVPSRRG